MLLHGDILSLLLFLPLVCVFALLCLRSDDHLWIRRLSLAVAITEFLLPLTLTTTWE
jgi:NADH:ubiquinone oxidoreductase subunit 4 (subunit M)